YEVELQRRRRIGRTIDPTTAETEFRCVMANDPYRILNERYHGNREGFGYFVRHPGASEKDWVHLYDLPRKTRTTFRTTDQQLISLDEWEMEFERRRRIGVTIDAATAETTSWWSGFADPYGMR